MFIKRFLVAPLHRNDISNKSVDVKLAFCSIKALIVWFYKMRECKACKVA